LSLYYPAMHESGRDELARKHMKLVNNVVFSMKKRFGFVAETEDIRSFALSGLAIAIDNFDESRGVPFGAYARGRIRGAVYDGLTEASWFPRSFLRKVAFYKKADQIMSYASQDPAPTDKVEATHRLADRLQEIAAMYITTGIGEEEENHMATPPVAEEQIEHIKYSEEVKKQIEKLPEKKRRLIKMYFYEDVTLSDIAIELGHSKSWASRVMQSTLKQLRMQFEETSFITGPPKV